jgi:hypothetical protein
MRIRERGCLCVCAYSYRAYVYARVLFNLFTTRERVGMLVVQLVLARSRCRWVCRQHLTETHRFCTLGIPKRFRFLTKSY